MNEFFDIDLNELDIELTRQPRLMYEYSSKLAHARNQMDRAKAKLEIVSAQLDGQIRENPSNYGITGKLTESLIQNTVLRQEEYKKAHLKLLNKKQDTDVLYACVNALEHKKSALEKLVMLHGQSYFAKPSIKDPAMKQVVNEHNKNNIRKKVTGNTNE